MICKHEMAEHHASDLLDNFGRLIKTVQPDLVTMENVPELAGRGRVVLDRFLAILERRGYSPRWAIVKCERYGVPQSRRRLVLLGSRLGQIELPKAPYQSPNRWETVEETIGTLRPLVSGEVDPNDPPHGAPRLSDLNLKRIRHTKPNGGHLERLARRPQACLALASSRRMWDRGETEWIQVMGADGAVVWEREA